MGESYRDASEWAGQVSPDQPHGLDELEAHVLGLSPSSAAAQTGGGASRRPTPGGKLLLALAGAAGPVAGATAFWDRSEAVRFSYSLSNAVAFPAAAIGFVLGAALLVALLVEWWRGGRHRDGVLFWVSAAVAVLAALTLGQARDEDVTGAIPGGAYLLPVWCAAALGIGGAVAGAAGRGRDAAEADAWHRRQQLANAQVQVRHDGLDALPPASVDALLDDRRRALEILRERGLLDPAHDVGELAGRPLGAFHQT